jgi:hypothetical protein
MPRNCACLLLALTTVFNPASLRAVDVVPSFLNDVVPVLTRTGCNQGACHGKGAGQNGFRLSLRGYASEQDYRWLTREFAGRRVDLSHPAASLLLRKPSGQAPHEGGKIFDVDNPAYQVLLKWIQAGAPAPRKDDPTLVQLAVEPAVKTLKIGDRQPLKALATYGDGSKRDVTWLTKFESNDAGLIAIDENGVATALRNGETAIRAAFQTGVAVTILTVPFEAEIPRDKLTARNNFIDDAVFAKLATLRIEPAELTSDEEFIRRAFIDAIGTLPTPDEVRQFLADKSTAKRSKLIDSLLERPEFVDYWTMLLCDLFQNRKERDHDVRGTKGVRAFHTWMRQQVAQNVPWDKLARAVLTPTGSTTDQPAVGYYIVTVGEHNEPERSEVVASVAQAFLGTRIGCAQCHNHPLERYTQDDYYHFAGFFSRIHLDRKDSKMGATILKVSARDPNQNKNLVGVVQPRTGEFLKPQPLDRSQVKIDSQEDPRQKLVDWMVDPNNGAFSGAMVNRIWKHYLGVGLVEPVDDLRLTNPPSNPELWKALNREFVNSGYDRKQLMRTILNSRTYQLSSATRPGNQTDTRFYSHSYARRISAEVLLDAISQCTGVPEQFPGYPLGMRALQVPDPGSPSYFLTVFGRSDRVTACACERMGDVTMPQVLHLSNSQGLFAKLQSPDGRLTKLLNEIKDDDRLIEELYLLTMSRIPTAQERGKLKEYVGRNKTRAEAFQDVMWALLNAKNFVFNH